MLSSLLVRRGGSRLATSLVQGSFTKNRNLAALRYLSTPPPPQQQQPLVQAEPPSEVTEEVAFGIQHATELYINHGLSKKRLEQIAAASGETDLVQQWQQMMEAFLAAQVHVLAGLGYAPSEQGLGLYNSQLGHYVQSASPEVQEELRVLGRDIWRTVLSTAFDLSKDQQKEMNIVDARNMMHKVSIKMQQPEILEMVSGQCAKLEPSQDGNPQMDMARKHQVIQKVLVQEVYLGGSPSLTEECGFEKGPQGYVQMQYTLAEHQTDPLVAQYVGASMMKLLQAAGLDLGAAAGISPS